MSAVRDRRLANERFVKMLGQKIKEIRTEQGLSCSELARRSGHPVSSVHNLENGKSLNPGFIFIRNIAKVLNISLDEISKWI